MLVRVRSPGGTQCLGDRNSSLSVVIRYPLEPVVTVHVGLDVVVTLRRLNAAAAARLQDSGHTRWNRLALELVSVLGVLLLTSKSTDEFPYFIISRPARCHCQLYFCRAACNAAAVWRGDFCLSVCLSFIRVDCDKTVERSVQIYIPYERTFILVF